MRFLSCAVVSVVTVLWFASPALAGNWGEDWGSMIWSSVAALPSLEGVGVWLLVISLFGAAAWRLRRPSIHASLVLVLIPLVPFLMAPHFTDWNGFTNGTVAESGVMNENFTMMQGGVNASNTANPVSVPYTFENATPADADQVNANFTALETGVNTALSNRATDCAALGGTWNAGTSTCTPAYNCFIGGFCSQAAIDFPPSAYGYTNAYEGHSLTTEPALGAGCGCEDFCDEHFMWIAGVDSPSAIFSSIFQTGNTYLRPICGGN